MVFPIPLFLLGAGLLVGYLLWLLLGHEARSRGGRGESLPAPLSSMLLFGFLVPLAGWTAWSVDAPNDAFYPPAMQSRLVVALVASSLIHYIWGMRMDNGGGGLHDLFILVAGQSILWVAGLRIESIRVPLLTGGDPISLDPAASYFATILWLSIVAAVIEWVDGVDGVASGLTGLAAFGIFIYASLFSPEDIFVREFALALMVAWIVLPWNCPGEKKFLPGPAQLALGKSGSLLLGHWLAVLTVLARLKGPAAGMLLPVGIVVAALVLLLFRFLDRSLEGRAQPNGTDSTASLATGA